jgi:hypothetical protein
MIKEFKLEILICFNSLITEHLTPLCQTPHIFAMLKAVGGKLQTVLNFKSKRTMCEDLTSFEFLNVCSPNYLPYQYI